MRRWALCAMGAWLLWTAPVGVAQEQPKSEQSGAAEEKEPSAIWAWLNFAMLAGGLGYLGVKKGGPYFAARTLTIRKGIAEADQIRAEAEKRAAEVDRKLASLQSDIEALRANAHNEQAAEAERIRLQTVAELERVREHAGREIEAAGKAARTELKRYAAQLAVDLAEQKIRRQMTPETQTVLVENFSRDLERPQAGEHQNR